MNGNIGRQFFCNDVRRIPENQVADVIAFNSPFSGFYKGIDFFFWQTKYFSQFTDDGFALIGNVCTQQANVFVAICVEKILIDGIPIIP